MRQRVDLPTFSKEIKLLFHVASNVFVNTIKNQSSVDEAVIKDNGIFLFQTILVEYKPYTLFFDSGCSEMVSCLSAIQRIGTRASLEFLGPISLGGVGAVKTESPHGVYQVRLPLAHGNDAIFSGICLDRIRNDFPLYPLHGAVQDDINEGFVKVGVEDLPKLPEAVGGHIDFMIGTKYLRYHPEKIFQLPSGLTIFRSVFKNAGGGYGVVGGPHEVFTNVERFHGHTGKTSYQSFLTNQYQLYEKGYQLNPDVLLLHVK